MYVSNVATHANVATDIATDVATGVGNMLLMYVANVATHATNVATNVSTDVGNIAQVKFQSHLHPIHGDLPVSLPLKNNVFMKAPSFKVLKF